MSLKKKIQKLRILIKKPFKIHHNKKLIKKYPFLETAYSRYEKKDYETTVLDMIPIGWRNAFGKQFCNDLLLQCQKTGANPKDIEINDIKEKWGVLTIDYTCPEDSGIDVIMDYYEDLSMLCCIHCGKSTKYQTKGWVNYICEDCAKKYHDVDKLTVLTVEEYAPIRTYYDLNGALVRSKSNVPFEKYWPEE